MSEEPQFEIAWEVTSPALPAEATDDDIVIALGAIHRLLGPFTLTRWNPIPPCSYSIMYRLTYCRNISFRRDSTWSGPGSICFYGTGGAGDTLQKCVTRAISEIEHFRGCIAVAPPRGIYGPVLAPERISLYGEAQPAINRAADLELAMAHVIGRVPEDWPNTTELEPVK